MPAPRANTEILSSKSKPDTKPHNFAGHNSSKSQAVTVGETALDRSQISCNYPLFPIIYQDQ